MSIIRSLYNRSYGTKKDDSCLLVNRCLVEEYQCYQCDEHPIIDDEEGTTVPPLACAFCPVKGYCHILALADENGCVIMYNTLKTGIRAAITEWLSHTNAVFDLTWLRTEQKLLTASGDQTVVLWDAVTSDKLEVFKGHTSSVKSVCIGHDNDAVFATGSRDGHIMIWDRRCLKKDQRIPPVNVIKNAHSLPPASASKSKKKTKLGPVLDSQQSVTSVLFQDSFNLLSAGAVDGVIKVWDLRKNYSTVTTDPVPKHSLVYSGFSSRKHGFSSLSLDSSHSKLFVSCTDDVIYQYDVTQYNPNPVYCYKGHQNSTFYVKSTVSPDDQYIASGSSDQAAYIWKIGSPQESAVTLTGHTAEVTTVAWSPDDFGKIATLSDDNTMRVWRATKRLTIPVPVIGTSQKVSKDIGVSAVMGSPVSKKLSVISRVCTTPSQRPSPKASLLGSSHGNIGSVKKSISSVIQTPPSIKKWFSLSQSKSQCEKENKASGKTAEVSVRTPVCKRKLIIVDNSDSENPSKRPCQPTLQDISSKENVSDESVSCDQLKTTGTLDQQNETHNHEMNSKNKLCEPELKNMSTLLSDMMASPVRKISDTTAGISSPTANLPNIVDGVGVVTPPRSTYLKCSLKKGRNNWLTKLCLQKQCDAPIPELLSPRSSNPTSQESEESDSISPSKLKSPIPGTKSILSYFKRREDRL